MPHFKPGGRNLWQYLVLMISGQEILGASKLVNANPIKGSVVRAPCRTAVCSLKFTDCLLLWWFWLKWRAGHCVWLAIICRVLRPTRKWIRLYIGNLIFNLRIPCGRVYIAERNYVQRKNFFPGADWMPPFFGVFCLLVADSKLLEYLTPHPCLNKQHSNNSCHHNQGI